MSTLKLKRALYHSVPPASNRTYQPGDQVLVWKEQVVNNRIGEWLGPFRVINMDPSKKLVLIQMREGETPKPYNVVQVKPYFPASSLSQLFLSDILDGLDKFKSPDDNDSILMTEILGLEDKRALSEEASRAKLAEVQGLLRRGTFRVIL